MANTFFPSTMYFNASQADRSLVANHSIIVSDFVTKFEEKYLVVDIQKKVKILDRGLSRPFLQST